MSVISLSSLSADCLPYIKLYGNDFNPDLCINSDIERGIEALVQDYALRIEEGFPTTIFDDLININGLLNPKGRFCHAEALHYRDELVKFSREFFLDKQRIAGEIMSFYMRSVSKESIFIDVSKFSKEVEEMFWTNQFVNNTLFKLQSLKNVFSNGNVLRKEYSLNELRILLQSNQGFEIGLSVFLETNKLMRRFRIMIDKILKNKDKNLDLSDLNLPLFSTVTSPLLNKSCTSSGLNPTSFVALSSAAFADLPLS